VHLASDAFSRVALYFENSILAPDLKLLPSAAACVRRIESVGSKWTIESPRGVGVAWRGPALVDGKPWPVLDGASGWRPPGTAPGEPCPGVDGATVWLPAGTHTVEPSSDTASHRMVDFNGDLEKAGTLPGGVIE